MSVLKFQRQLRNGQNLVQCYSVKGLNGNIVNLACNSLKKVGGGGTWNYVDSLLKGVGGGALETTWKSL